MYRPKSGEHDLIRLLLIGKLDAIRALSCLKLVSQLASCIVAVRTHLLHHHEQLGLLHVADAAVIVSFFVNFASQVLKGLIAWTTIPLWYEVFMRHQMLPGAPVRTAKLIHTTFR